MKKDYKNLVLIILFVFVLGISLNVYADNNVCTNLINDKFIEDLNKYVYVPIKLAVPVLLLVLTSVDFAQVVFAGKKENMEKAKNNFLKRAIAGIIIFFAPNIIDLVISFINDQSMSACMGNFK